MPIEEVFAMFYLMNKDNTVATFKDVGVLEENYKIKEIHGKLPSGLKSINEWIENRKASKHNSHLRKIMAECGCSTKSGFIKVTHGASLNDSFWIKSEQESVTWDDISLYKNEFNETISRLAFEGVGLYGMQFSDTSPELSTEGSFRKCWRKEKNDIFLYKRGSSGARNAGLGPYCEILASEVAEKICNNRVTYDLVKLNGEIASRCKLFTDENIGYVPMSKVSLENYGIDNLLRYYEELGSGEDFRRMVVLDSITFNVDRHLGNHGILMNNDNLEPISMAPVFDYNMALLPYVEKDDFSTIGNRMLQYGPRIGDDFTRIGQLILVPVIRTDLINLKGFEFSFRGDDVFTKERVKFLESLIEKQITAILSKNKLYTKDVFVPAIKEDIVVEKVPENKDEDEYLENISKEITKLLDADCYIIKNEFNQLELTVIPKQNKYICFIVPQEDSDLLITENDMEISYSEFAKGYSELLNFYTKLSKIVDDSKNIDYKQVAQDI